MTKPAANRLVVLGNSVTALAVARHSRALGFETIVADQDRGIAQRSSGARVIDLNQPLDQQKLEALCNLGGRKSFLLSTADSWLRFVMTHRASLQQSFAAILHPVNETLEICLSKQNFSAWCVANGFDMPRWFGPLDRERLAAVTFPIIVRPDRTLHSLPHAGLPKAKEVNSIDECRTLLGRYEAAGVTPVATESLLHRGVIQYSVPFAKVGERILSFCARKLRPSPDWCATGTYVEICEAPEIEKLARRAVETLDYYGIGEVEILHSAESGKSYLIEINARPWVQYALAPASGHNLLGFVLEGRNDASRPITKTGLRWMDFRSDFYVCFSRDAGMVRNGRLSFGAYVKSVLAANVYAKFNLLDLRPCLSDTIEWVHALSKKLRAG